VFRYAVQTALAERDPTVDIKGALAPLLFVRPASCVMRSAPSLILIALNPTGASPPEE
jgi:hypothetical protein